MIKEKLSRNFFPLLFSTSIFFNACGQVEEDYSLPLITDVDHSPVKRQSVGNCWLYAQASWIESLHRTATGQSFDSSETYWTYWHWYDQILASSYQGQMIREISTGGTWRTSLSIIKRYGIISEGNFIPSEAGSEMSKVQAYAESYINYALANGPLATQESRTKENIEAVLNRAFGVDMGQVRHLAIPYDEFQVATGPKLDQITVLSEILDDWQEYSLARYSPTSVFNFVKKALNDGQPVVMSMWVDFKYLNTKTGTFQGSIYDASETHEGGGHMVVLEDYVVNHPELGFLGEGEMDDQIKEKALEGELVYLKAKNSWGTNRPDRGLTDGYTRFTTEWLLDSSREELGYQYTRFVLPTGLYQ